MDELGVYRFSPTAHRGNSEVAGAQRGVEFPVTHPAAVVNDVDRERRRSYGAADDDRLQPEWRMAFVAAS